MKLFISGISGLLGLNFAMQTRERFTVSGAYLNHPVSLAGVEALPLNLISLDETTRVLHSIRPDVIVNAAGLTNVDGCEENPGVARQLNATVAGNIASIANALGSRMVHISTDQLFNGESPWTTEADVPAPINAYGLSKSLAEREVVEACPSALIIRTNFFGWGTPTRSSFSDWILLGLEEGRELTLFNDVFFTPILINRLVDVIIDLAMSDSSGIFHVGARERISKYHFGLELAAIFGHSAGCIRPISVEQFSFKAPRPKDMSMSSAKVEETLQVRMPSVAEGLEQLLDLKRHGWHQSLLEAGLTVTPP